MRGVVNICEPSSAHEKLNHVVQQKEVIRIRGEDEIGKSPVSG